MQTLAQRAALTGRLRSALELGGFWEYDEDSLATHTPRKVIRQFDVRRATGIDRALLSKYLSGQRVVSKKDAEKLGAVCGVPAAFLRDPDFAPLCAHGWPAGDDGACRNCATAIAAVIREGLGKLDAWLSCDSCSRLLVGDPLEGGVFEQHAWAVIGRHHGIRRHHGAFVPWDARFTRNDDGTVAMEAVPPPRVGKAPLDLAGLRGGLFHDAIEDARKLIPPGAHGHSDGGGRERRRSRRPTVDLYAPSGGRRDRAGELPP